MIRMEGDTLHCLDGQAGSGDQIVDRPSVEPSTTNQNPIKANE